MELLIICAVLGCIPAAIASSKGRSFGIWWIYGALLFIVALIHSLCLKKDHQAIEREQISEGLVKCPFCAEMIKPEAIKCKHCGSEVEPKSVTADDTVTEYVKYGLNNQPILDEVSVSDLARKLISEMPNNTPLSIMVTKAPIINSIKATMPPALARKFELLLESDIKAMKS